MRHVRNRSCSGRTNALFVGAWAHLIVLVLGVWFISGSTWRHSQFRSTSDPSNANVRTVEEVSQDTSSSDSYRCAHWREIRVQGEEWVRDGVFVQSNRTSVKVVQGTYRDGKREGTWSFWNEDGSIDSSRSGTYANDVLVHGPPSPKGDFDPDPEALPGSVERP